ncbi:Fur family transcriptional regulator [Pararobbsia silviterrae]|uniref:Fur family transcriptional regulator n=1 Tax=Pararobbsia silviterrae TaxID=1792498 RepID=UPI00269B046B
MPHDSPHAHAHDSTHRHALAEGDAAVPSPEQIERSLDIADEYCQARGERLTPIRRKVLGLLLASGRATKAYALLDQMRDMHPGSAPPTVYRALDFLLSANLIHRIETINAFSVCHDLTHCQHGILMVCQDCGRVEELHEPKLRKTLIAQVKQSGYRLSGEEIELKGLCPDCQARAEGKPAKRGKESHSDTTDAQSA